MNFPRSSGVLLHPTSLPGPYSIGDLGPEAYAFVDFLVASAQTHWQTLPLGPVGYGGSPYASYSAFAGNTLLISPHELVRDQLLDQSDLPATPPASQSRADFDAADKIKAPLLAKAYSCYQLGPSKLSGDFEAFKKSETAWLDEYALYQALKTESGGQSWVAWSDELRMREPSALTAAKVRLADDIEAQKFFQFLFARQWSELKRYANHRGVAIIGDLPIFVAHDSADVWSNPELFKLTPERLPSVVAGVPPDYFSETGQLWGNPIYNWKAMQADNFRWWTYRVRKLLSSVDAVRFDHFRGLAACWEIPAGDKTAERGQWVDAPGNELLTALTDSLGALPIIAEDLGVITPDVDALRERFGFPGMRVLQFAFDGDPSNSYLPHNFAPNVVVYTGTHDNQTTNGWFKGIGQNENVVDEEAAANSRRFCLKYLRSDGQEIHWDFIHAALSSTANLAIIPLQDILGLGDEARMNVPNTSEKNWTWRYRSGDLKEESTQRLRELTEIYGRAPKSI